MKQLNVAENERFRMAPPNISAISDIRWRVKLKTIRMSWLFPENAVDSSTKPFRIFALRTPSQATTNQGTNRQEGAMCTQQTPPACWEVTFVLTLERLKLSGRQWRGRGDTILLREENGLGQESEPITTVCQPQIQLVCSMEGATHP